MRQKRPDGPRRTHAMTPRNVDTQEANRQAYVDGEIQRGPHVI
jgi:hypothetical protein